MDRKLNQILELLEVVNQKASSLQQENEKLKNQNEIILKRIDDLELEVSNIPKAVKVVKKQEFLTIKDILKENPQIKKTTLYKYFQNHTINGLKVIQKDEGGTYTIKREDWDFWYNSQFTNALNFLDIKIDIEKILNEDDKISPEEKIDRVKKSLSDNNSNGKISNENSTELNFNF